jgi:ubiquinone/menaquinone biosynthesis C-methylase UbiE
MSNDRRYEYDAREAYQSYSVAEDYERSRFSSLLGKYRYAREHRAVNDLLDRIPDDVTFADCPCGIGRWWPVLARRAKKIVALDISEGMLRYAGEQASSIDLEVEVRKGDAEHLPLEDGSVDYTFSFALTKHLPLPVQFTVLAEFARVARRGVISTFCVMSHLTYEIWRHRNIHESFTILPEQLEWMAAGAGLKIEKMNKCTTPIGVERVVLFKKL